MTVMFVKHKLPELAVPSMVAKRCKARAQFPFVRDESQETMPAAAVARLGCKKLISRLPATRYSSNMSTHTNSNAITVVGSIHT